MFTGNKNRIHARSFHHRIKDGAAHFFDYNHFLGIDPLDSARFHDAFDQGVIKEEEMAERGVPIDDPGHLIGKE